MKNNKPLLIVLIVLLSVITLILIGFLTFMLITKSKNIDFDITSLNKEEKTLTMDQLYDQNFNNINIDVTSGNVKLLKSNSNQTRVVVYGKQENLTIDATNNLNIKYDEEPCVGICLNKKISRIEVYLPSNYQENIEITNNYGDINIKDFPNANIKINEKAGDVEVLSAKEIKINNDYGDIKIGRVIYADVNAKAGDIEIDSVTDLKTINNYGDITIGSVLNSLSIKEDCGDVEIDNLNITQNSNIQNDYGDIEIGRTNNIYIDAKTSLGDVNIRNNNRTSQIVLTIENDCGDIDIEN